ncbi:MAG: peptide chain release factor N(5)-glutamine methyltransferase [Shimia sp.]
MKTIEALALAGDRVSPRDARLLLGAVAGRPLPDEITPEQSVQYEAKLTRRAKSEPMSHILGRRAFWRHEFKVTSDTLDPRPETEVLMQAALEGPFETVLDLGTGSGCILLSLLAARPEAKGTGVDISAAALAVAGENANALDVADRTTLIEGSWFTPIAQRFDLIVSNPPYIAQAEMEGLAPELAYEPRIALTDEGDGLDAYRTILAGAGNHLTSAGRVLLEFGAGQAPWVQGIADQHGWQTRILKDLDGRDRAIVANLGQNPL